MAFPSFVCVLLEMKPTDFENHVILPSFFHVSGHVAKLATTLLSWPTAIALSAYQLTEVTNNVTYFVLKINVVLKQTLMFKSFNK